MLPNVDRGRANQLSPLSSLWLASQAGPGEILISDAAYSAANLNLGELEHQPLVLKGKSEPTGVRILHIVQDQAGHVSPFGDFVNVTMREE